MAFTQETFLGASIRSFTASLGWTTSPSTLNVALVEDSVNGDSFAPGVVGRPVQFDYQGWIFNGLLQSYKTSGDSGGYPLYEVTVVDPREILEGVHLILNGYNGNIYSVPNIINVYGYWENQEYGSSETNPSGMPWGKIANAVQNITNLSQIGTYGGPIKFLDSTYRINILGLPNISSSYRVGGDVITLMDFIIEVCEAANCDFFVTMDEVANGNFTIQVNTISRRSAQSLGGITAFINSITEFTSKNVGYEFLNNPTGKFIVGGQQENIFLQYSASGVMDDDSETYDEYSDDTIWPFWGFDADGNALLGIGVFTNDAHKFTLDARLINVEGVGAYYPTSVGEMRAALDSYESWEIYLNLKNDDASAPQYQRATNLGIPSLLGESITNVLNGTANIDQLRTVQPQRFAALTRRQSNIFRHESDDPHAENLVRLYDYVRTYASEYYGRRFMVRIPYVYIAREPETDIIRLSQEPTDSGFVDEDEWPTAITNNIIPANINQLTNEDGKILAYVRFDNATRLDLSALSPEDYVFNAGFTSVFVKCNVLPGVVYLNTQNLTNPRAVIELPGPVRRLGGTGITDFSGNLADIAQKVLELGVDAVTGADKFNYNHFPNGNPMTATDKRTLAKSVADSWLSQFAGDILHAGKLGAALLPELAGVPLKSNISTYGPWYNYGLGGKMEYEKDESLVPWNYGGYDIMNDVAQAKIDEALANQLVSEAGSVEFAGVPTVPLGLALIDGGPNVTEVIVSIGEGGATTVYQMQLSPRFGKFSKQNADRVARLGKLAQKQRRAIRNLQNTRRPNDKFFKERGASLTKPISKAVHSSHMLLAGSCSSLGITDVELETSGTLPIETYDMTVVAAPHYNILTQLKDNYEQKAVMGLDGMFVPFSTKLDASGIPHYRETESTGGINHRNFLDPFVTNHNISILARDSGVPENGLTRDGGYSDNNDYRGIALRAPVMIGGWGYDVNGDPVPAAESGDPSNPTGTGEARFAYGHVFRPNLWKVGPLDIKWDNSRGVWSAGSSATQSGQVDSLVSRGYTSQLIQPYGNGSGTLDSNGQDITITSWLGQPICEGQRVILLQENPSEPSGNYYAINSEFSQLDVISDITCVSGQIILTKCTIFIPSAFSTVVTNLVMS